MAVVITGRGTFHLPNFASPDNSALNTFHVEANCAYYIMPDMDLELRCDPEAKEHLTVFIATCDI
jgi:hypothetical protein